MPTAYGLKKPSLVIQPSYVTVGLRNFKNLNNFATETKRSKKPQVVTDKKSSIGTFQRKVKNRMSEEKLFLGRFFHTEI